MNFSKSFLLLKLVYSALITSKTITLYNSDGPSVSPLQVLKDIISITFYFPENLPKFLKI